MMNLKFTTGPYEIPIPADIQNSLLLPRVGDCICIPEKKVRDIFFKNFNKKVKSRRLRKEGLLNNLEKLTKYFIVCNDYINVMREHNFRSEAELKTKAEELAIGYITEIYLDVKYVIWDYEENTVEVRMGW